MFCGKGDNVSLALNNCRCGKEPKFKRQNRSLGGWNEGSVTDIWIECDCGLRTISFDDY